MFRPSSLRASSGYSGTNGERMPSAAAGTLTTCALICVHNVSSCWGKVPVIGFRKATGASMSAPA